MGLCEGKGRIFSWWAVFSFLLFFFLSCSSSLKASKFLRNTIYFLILHQQVNFLVVFINICRNAGCNEAVAVFPFTGRHISHSLLTHRNAVYSFKRKAVLNLF